MADRSEKKANVTLTLPPDVVRFIHAHGGARRTDLTIGKVNVSDEVADLIRHNLMSKVQPEVLGWELARRVEAARLEIEDANRQAQDLFGVSSIDEWVLREKEGERLESDLVAEQIKLRGQVKSEKMNELEKAWSLYHASGRKSRTSELAWAKGRSKELRLLEITPEEFVARMNRHRDSPEVG